MTTGKQMADKESIVIRATCSVSLLRAGVNVESFKGQS